MKKISVSYRLDEDVVERLRDASNGRYAPTQTAIIQRGIELALKELEKKK